MVCAASLQNVGDERGVAGERCHLIRPAVEFGRIAVAE